MKIMIDAGHGYKTPGKSSPDGMKEYEFNRSVAEYLKDLLTNYQVNTFFAHSDIVDVPLQERTNRANSLHVDLYVSIHANAAVNRGWHKAGGIETYIHTSGPKEALSLATKIQNKLIATTGLQNRGVKTADFHVLSATKMTAVLVECGFMTNEKEIKLLKSNHYRKKCAQAIAESIISHYSLKKKLSNPSKKSDPEKILYKIQLGAFSDKQNAANLATQLKRLGFETTIITDKQEC
ncbi:cell wall hydrolase [Bacillus sp. FJAT-27986]|nr:cell wall hydrolase [Bacillus sp. FJAT-27986]